MVVYFQLDKFQIPTEHPTLMRFQTSPAKNAA